MDIRGHLASPWPPHADSWIAPYFGLPVVQQGVSFSGFVTKRSVALLNNCTSNNEIWTPIPDAAKKIYTTTEGSVSA